MILSAHQPVYLPWLGLFHKIALSDLFCFFDIVQYQTKDYNNRNKVKTAEDTPWLTVPVNSKNHLEKKINEIEIVGDHWRKKHCKIIQLAYQNSPYFNMYFVELKRIISDTKIKKLSDLNFRILIFLLSCLNLKTKVVKASNYNFTGKKSDLVLDMCIKLKAKKYIFGSEGKNYAEIEKFKKNNIEVCFQNYNHPIYSQLYGNFIPYLSVIDLLFNMGSSSSEIIRSNNISKV